MKSPDEQWSIVKSHYEKLYKITFKSRPKEAEVQMLYRKMQLLADEYYQYVRDHFGPKSDPQAKIIDFPRQTT